jgi:hypothetical protein
MVSARETQPVTIFARVVLVTVVMLVFLAGIQLYILSEQTDHYFAWTIAPPLTAAFLGAGYWSALVSSIYALRERTWVRVRSNLPPALTATVLLLIATLIHIDRFHLNSPVFITWLAAWVWVIVYVVVPPLAIGVFLVQGRLPGANAASRHNLPRGLRVLLIALAVVSLVIGLALFLAPQATAPAWPWALTPLTARAVGAWFCAMGVTAAVILWEDDLERVSGPLLALCTFASLQLVALLRYLGSVDWAKPGAWLYVLWLLAILLTAGVGILYVKPWKRWRGRMKLME